MLGNIPLRAHTRKLGKQSRSLIVFCTEVGIGMTIRMRAMDLKLMICSLVGGDLSLRIHVG